MTATLPTGTLLNAAGILIGGIVGLTLRRQLTRPTQVALKGLLGVVVVIVGLKTTWTSLGGGFWLVLKQIAIVLLFTRSSVDATQRWSEGFITCTILFCVGPMAILGSIQDGLSGRWQTLGAKALMDGLATMAFVGTFGWGAMLAVVPVVAYQGTITLAAKFVAPWLSDPALMNSINATGGLLVFCIALIILELKKIELADYLPSLLFAPLLTWLWR